jgi:ribosomal protein S27E
VPAPRYRCNACGNLTVEDEEVLSEVVDEVSCRWCGTGASVEALHESEV